MKKVIIKSIGFDITDSIENHIVDHFNKVIDSFENFIVEDIVVNLKLDKLQQIASVRIPVKGPDLTLEATSDDMYASISDLAAKSSRKLRKLKEKSQSRGLNKRSFVEHDDDDEEY